MAPIISQTPITNDGRAVCDWAPRSPPSWLPVVASCAVWRW